MNDAAATQTPPAPRFSEVVLKTARFAEVQAWYETVLGVKAFFVRNDAKSPSWTGAYNIAFIRIYHQHPYTEVLGIFEIPAVKGQADGGGGEPGMHHMQLRFASLEDMFSRYERLRDMGIVPARCWNHGPGTSFYYRDPDGNTVELSGVNYPDEGEYLAFYRSEAYRKNVSGVEIDPVEYVGRFRSGTPREALVKIPV